MTTIKLYDNHVSSSMPKDSWEMRTADFKLVNVTIVYFCGMIPERHSPGTSMPSEKLTTNPRTDYVLL